MENTWFSRMPKELLESITCYNLPEVTLLPMQYPDMPPILSTNEYMLVPGGIVEKPPGPTGAMGDIGGPTGARGYIGATGATGYTGPAGAGGNNFKKYKGRSCMININYSNVSMHTLYFYDSYYYYYGNELEHINNILIKLYLLRDVMHEKDNFTLNIFDSVMFGKRNGKYFIGRELEINNKYLMNRIVNKLIEHIEICRVPIQES
jgi:hypothetical protein